MNNQEIQVILNVTHQCNMACKYCYYDDEMQRNSGNMDYKLLEVVIKKISESSYHNFNICLHGGEPLTQNVEFLHHYIKLQDKYLKSKRITNVLQTNGTLINENVIDFLIKSKESGKEFKIGISVDGPEEVHNSNRIYKNGLGSFETIMNNIDLLEKNNLNFGILSVINDATYQSKELIYPFLKSISSLSMVDLIIPQYFEDKRALNPSNLAEVYTYIFDDWFNDKDAKFDIRDFSSLINKVLGINAFNVCWTSPNCLANVMMVSIDVEGNVMPCDNYCDVKMGNIMNDDFDSFLKVNPTRKTIALHEKKRMEPCLFCEWYKVCSGGCPLNFSSEKKKSLYCEELKLIFDHVKNKMSTKGDRCIDMALIPNPVIKENLYKYCSNQSKTVTIPSV